MPELPEVEITKLKLSPVIGKTITSFWTDMSRNFISTLSPSQIAEDLTGHQIVTLTRTGKVLFIHLIKDENIKILAFHQRMSGRFKVSKSYGQPTKHTRLVITFSDGSQVHFIDARKFGIVWHGTEKEIIKYPYLNKLGPDALGVPFEEFNQRVRKFTGMVKPVLLRQDTVAGIGNIVVDETLWLSKIHPKTKISSLSERQIESIHISLQHVLKKSIKAKGSTLKDWKHPDGERGTFVDFMNVYGKKGVACVRCQNKIVRTVIGGRGTWVCTICQPI